MPYRFSHIATLVAILGLSAGATYAEDDHPHLSPGDEAYSAERYEEAAALYRKDAELGVVAAQVNLAFLYLDGLGVAQSDKEAAHWFQRAAEFGNAEAQQNIGLFYQQGKGVAQDLVEAYKWYKLADAKDSTVVEKQLTAEQLAEANKRADTWREAHKKPAKR